MGTGTARAAAKSAESSTRNSWSQRRLNTLSPRKFQLCDIVLGVKPTVAILIFALIACGAETPPVDTAATAAAAAVIPPPPTPEEAAGIIAGSAEFSDYQFTNASISLPFKEHAMTP